MTDETTNFGVLDYWLFGSTLLISFGIGIGTAFKGNQSPEEFLMGNRSLGAVPVAISLLSTFVSALTIIGFTSEIYAYGMQISLMLIGSMLGIVIAGVTVLPVLYPLKLTNVNEYVELRFKSSKLRSCITGITFVNALITVGLCLYSTSIALTAVTPLPFTTYIFIMGVLCTIYSTAGGIRAVVWTDVFQFIIMITGLVVIVVAGSVNAGGVGKVVSAAIEGGRLQIFNMNPSIYERHNFYNTIALGFFLFSTLYSVSQIHVQRISAVPTIDDVRIVLALNVIGITITFMIIFYGGLITYAIYAGCDPILEGKIQKKEEILSYLISDKLGFISGLPGIFVATLVTSTLSTFSAIVNAQVAIIWEDCISKLKMFSDVKPLVAAFINKVLTLLFGAAFIGMALLTSKATNLIQFMFTVNGIIFGAISGVFALGMFFPKCNLKGVWIGFLTSLCFLIWICVGSFLYTKPPDFLPLTTQSCGKRTSFLNSTVHETDSSTSVSRGTNPEVHSETPTTNDFIVLYLYEVSYTLYPMTGMFLCVAEGLLISYITGTQDPNDIPQELISPFLRKFYWKENN